MVGILIFDQVDLDVAGPFEVFSVTRLKEEHRWVESSPFRVLLVSERMDQVLAYGGLRLTPDVTIDNCPELDLLIVPGGWGTRTEVRNNNLLNWIAVRAAKTRLTASVCMGSKICMISQLMRSLRRPAPTSKRRPTVNHKSLHMDQSMFLIG